MDYVRLVRRSVKVMFRTVPLDRAGDRRFIAQGLIEVYESEGANLAGLALVCEDLAPEDRDAQVTLQECYLKLRDDCKTQLARHLDVVTVCSDGFARRLTKIEDELLHFESQTAKGASPSFGQRSAVARLFLQGELADTH